MWVTNGSNNLRANNSSWRRSQVTKRGRPNEIYGLSSKQPGQRIDVLSKTLLRASHDWLRSGFLTFWGVQNLCDIKNYEEYWDQISSYSDYLRLPPIWVYETQEVRIKFYLRVIIWKRLMKDNLNTKEDRDAYNNFYIVLKRYSHSRMEQLFSNDAVRVLYQWLLKGPWLDSMITNNPILSQDREKYEKVASHILKLFGE